MGCIIKLKLKEEYITFDSEAEAREYIKKNKIQIVNDLGLQDVKHDPIVTVEWARYHDNNYELSTAGDSRFSAKKAKFKDGTIIFGHDVSGRTIESVYQNGVKQNDWTTDSDKKTGKPKSKEIIKGNNEDASYYEGYLPLWQEWALQNPELIEDLRNKSKGKVLTDKFASSKVSQARALAEILSNPSNNVSKGGEFLTYITSQESIEKIIQESHQRAFRSTKEQLTIMKLNGWDSEIYSKNSDAFGISTFLSGLTVEGKRLFPEFITDNYLNVLVQNSICEYYLKLSNPKVTSFEIDDLRRKVFDETLSLKADDAKLKTAKEWLEYFKLYNKTPDFNIDDETLTKFDNDAQAENDKNFEAMLRGEVIHKIFEGVINGYSEDYIKNSVEKLFAEDGSFLQKYGQSYTEVPNSEQIIRNISNTIYKNFPNYVNMCKNYKKHILNKFKGKEVKLLSERRITADLSDKITIDGITKNKIRGKLDLIVLVDGVPHIIDLKVSHNPIDDWHQEKRLKTRYQLAAYYRLLNRIGINTSETTTNVLSFTINNEGNINENLSTLSDLTAEVVHDNKINNNLEQLFDTVKREPVVDIEIIDKVEKNIQFLFGDGSAKTQKQYTEEHFYNDLKEKVTIKDGKYTISYHIYEADGKPHWHKKEVTKEQLEDNLRELAKEIHDAYSNRFNIVFDQFISDVKSYITGRKEIEEFVCAKDNKDMVSYLKSLLLKYKNSSSEIIFQEIGSKFNTIFIKTSLGIDSIKCSHIDPHSPWDIKSKNQPLFNIPGVKSSKLKKTVGNVQVASTILLLNQLLNGTNYKVGEILCLSFKERHGYKCTVDAMKEINNISNDALLLNNINAPRHINNESFIDPLQNVMFAFNNFLNETGKLKGKSIIKKQMISEDDTGILKTINENPLSFLEMKIDDYDVSEKIKILTMLKDSLIDNFSDYFNNIDGSIIVDEITMLRYMIETAISIYEHREFIVESDISKYGLSKGFYLASMDLIPEENIQIVNNIVQTGFSNVRMRFQKQRLELKNHLDKFKKGNEYGSFRQYMVGDVATNYFNLFERTPDGKLINGDLKFRNPWRDKLLNDHEREFLKYVLFVINRQHKKLKTLSDLKESILKEEDYLCPLMRTKGLDRFRDPNGGIKFPYTSKAYFHESINRMRNKILDAGNLLEGQIEERTKASDLLKSMYNEYKTRTNPEIRSNLISSTGGIESFTMDVETILDSLFLAEDMEEIFELDVLPKVQSIMFVSVFQANITNLKMPNFKEFVKEYMKSAVYGDSIVNDEAKKFFKVLGPVRAAGAAIALSYNVVNLPREMLMGFFTNCSRAMFKTYGSETFNLKDYLHAFGILSGDVPNFVHNVTKIELLNELYGMSNMSINEIPEQVTSNKTGIFALGGRFSTWTITAPDYWNRMSIFIAQMLHDGCWGAYELKHEDGMPIELVYNMSKDKRFDILYKYRSAYINPELVKNIPGDLRKKFNEQAALYRIMKEDFSKELEPEFRPKPININSKNLEDQFELLPQAYTNKQRNSMKSLADMSFGYYDRETKAHFFKTSIGLVFKQFMAYMSAKKMQYFQIRSNTTSRGSYKQLEDAKGQKIWSVLLPNNEIRIVTDEILNTELAEYKDYAQPKMAWTGTYMEGIFQSYMHLFHDLGVGTYTALKGDGTDMLQKLWREYGKSGDMRHSNMLQGLYDLLLGLIFPWLLKLIIFDDPEKTGKSEKAQKNEMSIWAQNGYYIANTALTDFNIFSAITKFAFKWEAPSFSILQNSFIQFWSAFGDDDLTLAEEFLKGSTRSIGAFKFWRPLVDEAIA